MNIKSVLKLLRVHQWIKNTFVFIPLVFSGRFFDINSILNTSLTFIAFCCAASFVYIINDISDVEDDRKHYKKKYRPIANGEISIFVGSIIAGVILILSMLLGILIGLDVLLVLIIYILLNILYTFKIKHIPVWDIALLSFFYLIRIYAGGFAIDVPITSWLLLTAFFATLFIGSGKRYVELSVNGSGSRKVLEHYSSEYLLYTLYLTSFCTILFYSLYALTRTIYFQVSIIFVVVGFLNYFYYLFKNDIHEDPVLALLKNRTILFIFLIWAIYVGGIIFLKI